MTVARQPVYTEKNACQDCYKCVRECPLKAIRIEDNTAGILFEDCVYCGGCTRVCPVNAKRIRDDRDTVRELLARPEPCIVSFAPSGRAAYPQISIGQWAQWAHSLGFAALSETAHGADQASAHIAEEIRRTHTRRKCYISTACPAVVRYIRIYAPHLIPYLTEAPSPLHMHALMIHEKMPEANVVFVGPCAAKKLEAEAFPDQIAAALSFRDFLTLRSDVPPLLETLPEAEPLFARPAQGLLYPMDYGMCRSLESFNLKADVPDLYFTAISGLEEIIAFFRDLNPGTLSRPTFIEALACKGGCIAGPTLEADALKNRLERQLTLESEADAQEQTVIPLSLEPGNGLYPPLSKAARLITPAEIQAALLSVGKDCPEKELNCSGCGYDSCRDFARALVLGKAEKTMCVSYMRNLVHKKATALMASMPSGVAIIDHALRIIEHNTQFARVLGDKVMELNTMRNGLEGIDLGDFLAEACEYVGNLLSERKTEAVSRQIKQENRVYQITVFSIEPGMYAGLIVNDQTLPSIQREQIVAQARNVMEKNLKMVQNIAWLLGENAAESEVTLNTMIQYVTEGDSKTEKGV